MFARVGVLEILTLPVMLPLMMAVAMGPHGMGLMVTFLVQLGP